MLTWARFGGLAPRLTMAENGRCANVPSLAQVGDEHGQHMQRLTTRLLLVVVADQTDTDAAGIAKDTLCSSWRVPAAMRADFVGGPALVDRGTVWRYEIMIPDV